MNLLSRLLGLGLLAVLATVLLLTSCESARRGQGETAVPSKSSSTGNDGADLTAARPIAQFADDGKVAYKTPQATLAAAFIRQFADGTVVDKIIVRRAPGAPGEKTTCFLVGMGLRNGNFRAMALPLAQGVDGDTYYLSPGAARYVLSGVGCPMCYFNFDDSGQITGTTCGENSNGSSCDLRIERSNTMFASR